jgi:diguanylate cyclase (GGDEF)-like protein
MENTMKSITSCMIETTEILDEVVGAQSLERTLHDIVRKLVDHLECKTCAIVQLNPKTEVLEVLNSHGLSWNFCKEYRKRLAIPVIEDLIWRNQAYVIRDSEHSSELAQILQMEHPFRSCYCVGLSANQRPIGYLFVDSGEADHFAADRQMIVRLFARIISMAILKHRLLEDIEKLAVHEVETGVLKYHYFYGRLHEVYSKAERLNEHLSVLLIDVIKFDKILSSYGVDVGREMMNELITTVQGSLREYDELSRFGADEIIVSLPGTDCEQAFACAEKIEKLISEATFTEHNLQIKVNIGLATYPENASNLDGLLTATKNALYEAKRNRNEFILPCDQYYS